MSVSAHITHQATIFWFRLSLKDAKQTSESLTVQRSFTFSSTRTKMTFMSLNAAAQQHHAASPCLQVLQLASFNGGHQERMKCKEGALLLF